MAYNRIYNFSAGPSVLPEEVLVKASSEMLNYQESGMSVMEMSHRSKVYESIIFEAEKLFHEVMNIPEDYKVLFLQGGATQQFAMIPMNLMTKNKKADYILSGNFSTKAYEEALKYGEINVAGSTKDINFAHVPTQADLNLSSDADYVHYCMNNTIYGSRFTYIPETGNVPLVCDVSSCILSEPLDVTKFALLYAGAQKNVAPAGLTIVIIRKDMLGEPIPTTPTMLNYATMAKSDSMYNTPSCYPIYICKLVLEWIRDNGGLEARKVYNEKKAAILYDFFDNDTKMFKPNIDKCDRSLMNVTFKTGDADLDKKFIKEATAAGFVNLAGHRVAGGMRASIYNAMPIEGVEKLVAFMKEFEANN